MLNTISSRTLAVAGAIAWLIVPIATQVSSAADRGSGWTGLAIQAYLVSTVGLLAAGVVLVLLTLDATRNYRSVPAWFGIGLLGIGTLVSAIAAWAIPVWAIAYGVGMLVVAAATGKRRIGVTIGVSLILAPVILIALTELQVGTPDSYGDYPVAWTTAVWVAGIGAAAGMLWWSRQTTDAGASVI